MRERVVEIAEDGRRLARSRGFMTVSSSGEEIGRIPLDDIGTVLVTGQGAIYTNNLLVALAERGVALVVCAPNYLPVAWLWPVEGHHVQAERMAKQLEATRPLGKRLWRDIVRAKIEQQAGILDFLDKPSKGVGNFARRVKSGDPDNIEAQAARRYWPLVFGKNFRRDRELGGINSFLNYGYTVIRAATARAIVTSGLHPSIGIHHSNRYDHLRLADDLMEPFRPFVDLMAFFLIKRGVTSLTPDAKCSLALILSHDLPTVAGTTPISTCLLRLAQSLARSYMTRHAVLDLPFKIRPLDLSAWDLP